MILSFSQTQRFQKNILRWYQSHKRELPWRATKDPYKVWVSEIMLQQTQVATVIPYYLRWLRSFPTLKALAEAPLSRVLQHWAGLGYYRRARMLHKTACYIYEKRKGQIPKTIEDLQKLPGIGKYTAGAIASIAYNQKEPVLDGNVIRVLTRVFAIPQNIDQAKTLQLLWEIEAGLLPAQRPGDFNQALMELGATLCFPTNPECRRCPIKKICRAHAIKKETDYPVRSNRERIQKIRMVALVQQYRKKKVWIVKQPESGRWGGLWMFPYWKNKKAMFEEIRINKVRLTHFLTVRHSFTKYRIVLEVYFLKTRKMVLDDRKYLGRWVDIPELSKNAFPSPHRRIVEKLMAGKIP